MLSAEPHKGNREASGEESYGRFLYNRFRYYDPELGRYVSAEPIGQFGLLIPTGLRHARAQLAPGGRQANPLLVGRLGANLYPYALNDPIGLYDPDGEFAWAVPLVGGAIGAVSAGFGAASNPDADGTTIAAAAAVGFVAGAASTFSFGITNPFAAGAVAGGIAGGLGNLVGQGVAAANSCQDFEPDLASAANSALAGVVGGTVGAAFGPAGLGAAGAASATAQAGAAGATAAWLEAAASGGIP